MRRLTETIKGHRWSTENGDYIYLDDFGDYKVMVNGFCECTSTFEKAVRILNDKRYY